MTDPRAPAAVLDKVPVELWERRNSHRLRQWLDRHHVRPSLAQIEQRRAALHDHRSTNEGDTDD